MSYGVIAVMPASVSQHDAIVSCGEKASEVHGFWGAIGNRRPPKWRVSHKCQRNRPNRRRTKSREPAC